MRQLQLVRGDDRRTLHPLYYTWKSMVQRCYTKENKDFHRYGGRGIKVCTQWKNDFWQFVLDMKERPSKVHTIDRKDNDGNYEPLNCRWATKTQQATNRARKGSRREVAQQTCVLEHTEKP